MTGPLRNTPTASSPLVGELRRLLIDPVRLAQAQRTDAPLSLASDEAHYVKRVLRRRIGDALAITDGCGRLWEGVLEEGQLLRLGSLPCVQQPPSSPRLGLAVAITRRGFDDALRMACELGVDAIQPLHCARCTPQAEHRPERWQTILREAVEQCERLWMPTLHDLQPIDSWSSPSLSVAVGVTRSEGLPSLSGWLEQQQDPWVWMVVGPEGGWDEREQRCFVDRSWQPVHLGDSILRSSTAVVRSAVELVQWRERLAL